MGTTVGIILAIAMLVAPGAIAFLLTRRFEHMVVAAILVATLSSLLGVYLSFFIDSAPAPTIVLLMTAAFILAVLFSPNRSARLEPQELARRTEEGTERSPIG